MMTSTVTPLAVGQVAPEFALRDQNGVEVSLAELTATKNVVVVFYPFAFSGICTGELDEIRDHLERFVADDLQVVCISCDPMFALRAWADAQGYFFPLLSDYWPHGEVTRSFGVLNDATGAPIWLHHVAGLENATTSACTDSSPGSKRTPNISSPATACPGRLPYAKPR